MESIIKDCIINHLNQFSLIEIASMDLLKIDQT